MIDKKNLAVQIICFALWAVALVYVILVSLLTSPVATHINAFNVVDAVGSALWLLPLGVLVMILSISLFIFSFVKKEYKNREIINLYLLSIAAFIMVIGWVYYAIAAGGYGLGDKVGVSMAMGILIPFGILLMIIGNYAPRLQPNYWCGYRIKKAIDNPTVWKRTQRVGGITSVVCGLLIIVGAIIFGCLGLDVWSLIVLGVSIIAIIVAPLIAAYSGGNSTKEITQNNVENK